MASIQSIGSTNYTSQSSANESLERLASGSKINSAKDDPAGLAISDGMDSQLRGVDMALRNAGDGISLAQTADGALSESTSALQRMRELAVQSGNATYSASDRAALNSEFKQLQQQVDSIGSNTTFNGQQLLDGSNTSGWNFQVGTESSEDVTLNLDSATASGIGIDALSIGTASDAQDAIGVIDEALSSVTDMRGDIGAVQSSLESSAATLSNEMENIAAAKSRIADTDYAQEVSNLVRTNILEQAGVAMQVQQNNLEGNAALSLLK